MNTDPVTELISSVTKYAKAIEDFLFPLAGGIAVIFVILGGYQYLTSGGNQEKIASAKATLLWAIIGLVIIILAGTIIAIWENLLTKPLSLLKILY